MAVLLMCKIVGFALDHGLKLLVLSRNLWTLSQLQFQVLWS